MLIPEHVQLSETSNKMQSDLHDIGENLGAVDPGEVLRDGQQRHRARWVRLFVDPYGGLSRYAAWA